MTILADMNPVVAYLILVCAIALYLSVGTAVIEWWLRNAPKEPTMVSPDGGYRTRKAAERSRRTAARLERETAERKLCVCTHVRQRHMFGRQCDMPRCRCKSFEAA